MVYSVGERISVWLRCVEHRWDKTGKREEAKSCGPGKTFRFYWKHNPFKVVKQCCIVIQFILKKIITLAIFWWEQGSQATTAVIWERVENGLQLEGNCWRMKNMQGSRKGKIYWK